MLFKQKLRFIIPIYIVLSIIIFLMFFADRFRITYKYNSDNDTYILEKVYGEKEKIEVVDKYKNKIVDEIGIRAFYRKDKLKEVTFENISNVKKIDKLAFAYCAKLSKIDLSYVEQIDRNAFEWTNLKEVNLDNIKFIGASAFLDTPIEEIHLGDNLKSIGSMAFTHTKFEEITIPSNCKYIYEDAFYKSSIKTINIYNINNLDDDSIDYIYSLEDVEINMINRTNIINQNKIAHAMGEIDGYTYTNSMEAFLYNYEKGARYFEVDFDYLDNHLICCHDYSKWKTFVDDDITYTYENFKKTPITTNGYHTIDIDDLALILNEYDDVYIITDTKYNDEETVKKQFEEIYEKCKDNIDRIIPQIYTKKMYSYILDIYDFPSMIFTLYFLNDWDPRDISSFMINHNIPIVTMWDYLCTEDCCEIFKEKNITICAHTVNNINKANELFGYGCDIIYTDNLINI